MLEVFITVLIGVLGSNGLWAFIQSRSKRKTAQEKMLIGLGHAQIFRLSEHYLKRGGITADELEDLVHYLYEPYVALGGNGTSATLVAQCKELPILSAEEAARKDKEEEML